MADTYTLPMNLAGIPGQAPMRSVAQDVQPFTPVDPFASAGQALTLAGQFSRTDEQLQTRRDQQTLQEALKSGANIQTPEGVQQLADSLKGRVSPTMYTDLVKLRGEVERSAVQAETNLRKLDSARLQQITDQSEFAVQNLSSLMSEYEKSVSEKGVPGALEDFNTQKQASVQSMLQMKTIQPAQAQELMQMTPGQLKAKIESSQYWVDKMKKTAEARKAEAMAEMYAGRAADGGGIMGSSKVAEVRRMVKAGEISEEEGLRLIRGALGGAGAGEATIAPETLKTMAEQYLAGDKSVFTNLGRGVQGGANVTALRQAIAQEAKNKGYSGADIAQITAEFEGQKAGQRTLGTRTATVGMAVNEADLLADLALNASGEWKRSGVKSLNDLQKAVQSRTASPELRQFEAATTSFINAYARAISPTGAPTVSDKEHARQMLDTSFSTGDFSATIEQLKKEMRAAQQSPGKTMQEMRKLGGRGGPAADGAADLETSINQMETTLRDITPGSATAQRLERDIASARQELGRLGGGQGAPAAPKGESAPQKNAAGLFVIKSPADIKAAGLKKGDKFVGPDGVERTLKKVPD